MAYNKEHNTLQTPKPAHGICLINNLINNPITRQDPSWHIFTVTGKQFCRTRQPKLGTLSAWESLYLSTQLLSRSFSLFPSYPSIRTSILPALILQSMSKSWVVLSHSNPREESSVTLSFHPYLSRVFRVWNPPAAIQEKWRRRELCTSWAGSLHPQEFNKQLPGIWNETHLCVYL